jgi:hypothetical protein
MSRVLLPLMLVGSLSYARGQEAADDPPAQDAKALTAEFRKQARHMMLQYEFKLPEHPDLKIELIPEPVLYWTNPIAGKWEGAVYLWTVEGRPAVIASPLHQTDRRKMAHEFHQLTESPLTGLRNGEVVWRTSESGVAWKLVPGAEAPAATATARGLQMRSLARKFSAKKTGPEKVVHDMRLLPRPIYRYPAVEGKDAIDGACFILSQTTDPEIVVLLEARKTGAASQWFYALARLNQHEFVVSYDDLPVMNFPFIPFRERSDPQTPYTKFYNQLYQDLP